MEGHPNGKNMKKQNSPKMSRTTSYQKIDNVKYFRSPPTSSKPDTVVRNVCVRSIDPRDDKHGSELELHPVFVQELGARLEKRGKEEEGETASIHRRITQDFMDTEDCQQDKLDTEVISNYTYDNYNQNQSGQVMRASSNAIIPSSSSAWVHVKERGSLGGREYSPYPETSRFNRLTHVQSNIHSSPSYQEFKLSHD